jgi:DNA polymerase-3 subunit delta
MTLDALRSELEAGRLRPSYLLAGAEALLRDDALAAIRSAALAGAAADFDCERLDGESASAAALLDALATLPVLAPRRVVILREPDARAGAARGVPDALAEALPALRDRRDCVLVVVAQQLDRRLRWVKRFDDDAVVSCEAPRGERALADFIVGEARRQRVECEAAAIALLAERVGPQLLALRHEIAKAALFAGPGERVTAAHVAASTTDVADQPIWDLTDAIGEGRCGEALALLAKLLRAGSAPPAVLSAFVNHFRKLLCLRGGGSVAGPRFAIAKLDAQARRFSEARLLACLTAIHQTDLSLKGARGIAPELALERLVLALAQ